MFKYLDDWKDNRADETSTSFLGVLFYFQKTKKIRYINKRLKYEVKRNYSRIT